MKSSIVLFILCILFIGCKDEPTESPQNLTPISARDKLADVNALSLSYGNTMHIMKVVSNNVNPDGTSNLWLYEYFDVASSSMIASYWFHATSNGAAYDSTTATPVGVSVIIGTWIDTRTALDTAEQRGGAAFRAGHTHTGIRAMLSEPVIPDAFPMWSIEYYPTDGTGPTFGVEINALTGEYIVSFSRTP